jgi:DNA-binding NtrC family response regulator
MTPQVSKTARRILVVDDHAQARESMADILRCSGHRVECRASAVEGLRDLNGSAFDVVITDLKMPGMSGLEFIRALHSRGADCQILMVTAHASVATAVEAMRHGAFDYIEKPFTADQLEQLVERAMKHGEFIERRASVLPSEAAEGCMVGSSQAMKTLRARIEQLAPTTETVLILGESGVGKELVARAIHLASGRAENSLVSVNCPALSPQLMESELFGHERGSFTNADAPRVGRFELAEKGTLLLDEVTEIGLELQAKLLRVLQERSYERVGSSDSRRADVRVLASSNRDLQQQVAEGQFRQDLYFRLAVVPLQVPPLREREGDLPELIDHFLQQAAGRLGRESCFFADDARELLQEYDWPGNVRELENIVTRACVLFGGQVVGADDLIGWLIRDLQEPPPETPEAIAAVGMNLQEMERRLVEATLEKYGGHRVQTARALGIGVRTLTNKLRIYGYAPREKSRAAA